MSPGRGWRARMICPRAVFPTNPKRRGTPRPAFRQWWIWIGGAGLWFRTAVGRVFPGASLAVACRTGQAPLPRIEPVQGKISDNTPRVGGERVAGSSHPGAQSGTQLAIFQAARTIYLEEMFNRQDADALARHTVWRCCSLHEGDLCSGRRAYLNRSVQAGDDIADCCLLRASLAGLKSNYGEAVSTQLAAAVSRAAVQRKILFLLGRSRCAVLAGCPMPSNGSPKTLDRPDNAPARELYLFKLRLARSGIRRRARLSTRRLPRASSSPTPAVTGCCCQRHGRSSSRNFALAAGAATNKPERPPCRRRCSARTYRIISFQAQAARSGTERHPQRASPGQPTSQAERADPGPRRLDGGGSGPGCLAALLLKAE